jgi:hypothetical protein
VARVVKEGRAYPSSAPVGAIATALKTADPEVQALGLKAFAHAYAGIPDPMVAPGGQITPNQAKVLRDRARGFVRAVPGGDAALLRLPHLTSRWQATRKEADKFRHDGRFASYPPVVGTWSLVDEAASVAEFDPEKTNPPKKPPVRTITFKEGGKTDNAMRVWTGTTLIDLGRGEALKTGVTRGANGYLFIEAGGFGAHHAADWQCPYHVFERKQ